MEVATVEVALKLPKVGVEVAVITPEELVDRREFTEAPERVRPENVGLAVVFTLWSNQSLSVGAPFTVKALPLTVRAEVKRLVEDAVVEKKLVVVALVPVAFRKVKFCKVDEPVTRRLERVESPPVAVSVPVKLAALEIVWLFIKPEVIAPRVALPVVRVVEKRLVLDAVVEKKFVVVALVPVAFTKVKFWRVEEAVIRRLAAVKRPVVEALPEI